MCIKHKCYRGSVNNHEQRYYILDLLVDDYTTLWLQNYLTILFRRIGNRVEL